MRKKELLEGTKGHQEDRPSDHFQSIASHNNIDNVHDFVGQYYLTLKYHNLLLEISKKFLPSQILRFHQCSRI